MTNFEKKINKLISEINSGNEKSLTELYKIMSPHIRYIALKYLQDEEDAEDMVQDFWADIYKLCASIVFLKNGFAYLCKAMERKTINRYKKLKREKEKKIAYVDYLQIKDYADKSIQEAEKRIEITNIINSLPKIERIIIQETYFGGKTVRQIAEELKISKSQVSLLKNKAVEYLKEKFEKFGQNE